MLGSAMKLPVSPQSKIQFTASGRANVNTHSYFVSVSWKGLREPELHSWAKFSRSQYHRGEVFPDGLLSSPATGWSARFRVSTLSVP